MPMMASRWRSSMPTVFDSALNTTPTRIDAAIMTATPATPPG